MQGRAGRRTKSLNAVLDYLELLNKLDTSAVEPAAHVLPLKNIFREDRPQQSLDKELVLANAPEEEEGSLSCPVLFKQEVFVFDAFTYTISTPAW